LVLELNQRSRSPSCSQIAFKNGEIVAKMVGAAGEPGVRAFLEKATSA